MSAPTLDRFTTAELAAYLGVSAVTIRRMHAAGMGPPGYKLSDAGRYGGRGSPNYYTRADVDAWLAARQAGDRRRAPRSYRRRSRV